MRLPTRFAIFLSVFTCLSASTVYANACSKSEIDHYLKSGFTHEQVMRLCSNTAVMEKETSQPVPGPGLPRSETGSSAQQAPATGAQPAQAVATPVTAAVNPDDLLYFKTVIESDQVELTDEHLVYTLSGCIKYGEPDFTVFREEACVDTTTTISRTGLEVIKAKKGVFLLRDSALIVSGDISREVLNLEKLKKKKQDAFLAEYHLAPEQLDIPVRSGVDPKDVAERLQKIAK